MQFSSIGFRTKTAKAVAIALKSDQAGLAYVARWNVSLYDPSVPATGQPYHEVMELPWENARSAVRRLEEQIERVAREAIASLIEELRRQDLVVNRVGIVGSPDRPLEKIGNTHIRAHAAEGILFRRVLEVAAAHHGLSWKTYSDRTFNQFAASEFATCSQLVKPTLDAIGRAAGRPWRTDERSAATAAWLTLKNS
jgi:hypothetical protein